jgi:hypothetical protein
MRIVVPSLCWMVVWTTAMTAAEPLTIAFTVHAGKQARRNEPVCLPLQVPADANVQSAAIVTDKGQSLTVGQLTQPDLLTRAIAAQPGKKRLDLHFLLPELAADETLALQAILSEGTSKGAVFRWQPGDEEYTTDLRFDGRPVLRYVHPKLDESSKAARDRTFKVFHHVYDPTGKVLLTNGAGGDFPHHRGLFYGFMKCGYDKNTVDTWHCRGDAHQAHVAFEQVEAGPVLGRHRVRIEWNGVGKKTFASERREVTAYATPGGTLLSFVSELTPTAGPVKLDGDPQHAGFHFRASNEVSAKHKKETIFIRPDGVGKPGTEVNWPGNKQHVNLPWLAMSFVVGDQRYTVCYLDRPENPKEARFSERTYGRIGSYFVTTVTPDKPLVVAYRVWLQAGQPMPETIAALAKAFTQPVEVKQK